MSLVIFNIVRTLNKRQQIGCFTAITLTIIFLIIKYFSYNNQFEINPYLPSVVISSRIKYIANSLKIPRVIHQTWSSHHLPETFHGWVLSWLELHPNWEYKFWTDDEMRLYVKINNPELLKLYDSYPHQAYRNDAFRYILLYNDGGLYIDLDMEAKKNIDELFVNSDCLISQEPEEHAHFLSDLSSPPLVSNALMGCRKKHPFFKNLLQRLTTSSGIFFWNNVLHATGPYVVTDAYKAYISGGWFGEAPTDLQLSPSNYFHPRLDESMVDKIRQVCVHSHGHEFPSKRFEERQIRLCDKILKPNGHLPLDSNAVIFADHHWTHTWAGKRNDPFAILETKQKFDIRNILSLAKPKERIA